MRDEIETFSCKHDRLVFDDQTGEHICKGCGRVIDVSGNGTSNGVGFSPLLGSRILQKDMDMLGIYPKLQYEYPKEVAWYEAIEKLGKMARMPQYVLNSTYQFYLRYKDEMKRMRRKEAKTALMYAYSKDRAGKTLKDLCEETHSQQLISRRYLFDLATKYELKVPYRSPASYVSLYASKLNTPREIEDEAISILEKYDGEGRNPRSVAASSLYLAYRHSGERMTQRELAEYAGVAEYTVREVSESIRRSIGGDSYG